MMRKLRKISFVSVLLLSLMMSIALATATELQPTEGKTFSVQFDTEDAGNAGEQYVLLIIAKGTELESLSVNSILYIDQAIADEEGKVTFGPLQLKRHVSADVYIGGWSLESPANPYFIEVAGVEVSGTFSIPGTSPTVELGTGGISDFSSSLTAVIDGNKFTFETVPTGEYVLKISKAGYLSYYKSVTVEGEPIEAILTAYALPAGDINSDGSVNPADLAMFLSDFGKSDSFIYANSDLNNDSSVNPADLSQLLAGFGKSSISIADLAE